MLYIILVFVFISVFLFSYTVIMLLFKNRKAISRLKGYTSSENIREEKVKNGHNDILNGLNLISKGFLNTRLLGKYKNDVQQFLTKAHLLLKPEEYISICLLLSTISGLLGYFFFDAFLQITAFIIIGWLIPGFIIKARIKKRMKLLNEQLNDAIVLISNSLKAGFSFFQAVDTLTKEMKGPIAEEFMTLKKETNLGVTMEKALENTIKRVPSDDFELVITAVQIQRQVGGNLSEVLDNISSTIRERIKIKGEVKTITAQGRMSGLIISLLPPGLGFIVYLISPEHISVLFTNPLGILIVVFSIMMELMGIFFIRKIVRIDL